MTEFGDKVAMYMNSINGDGIDEKEKNITKRQKKQTTYRYEAEVSGIDAIITYYVSDKEKMKLVMFLSQTNEDGLPVCFIQEKGRNLICDETTLKSFLNGLSHADMFPDGYVNISDKKTGEICESVPRIYKSNGGDYSNRFIRCFLFMITHKKFVEHIKQGLINLEVMYRIIDYQEGRSHWGRESLYIPWFIRVSGRYGLSMDEFEQAYTPGKRRVFNEEKGEIEDVFDPDYYPYLAEDNNGLHLKMFKAGMKHALEDDSLNKVTALLNFYSDRTDVGRRDHKNFTQLLYYSFLILANRYDEPYATECMMDYLTHPKLNNLYYDKLDNLLRINARAYAIGAGIVHSPNDRYNTSYTTVPGSLIYHRMTEENEKLTLKLNKTSLWDYILYESTMGRGDNLGDMISTWIDYLTGHLSFYGKVDDKYPEYLGDMEVKILDQCKNLKEFDKAELLKMKAGIGAKYCELSIGEYELHIFTEVKEFIDEAAYMGNCLEKMDYATRVTEGRHWIGSFRKKNNLDQKSIFTVEISPVTGMMTQIKCRFNHLPVSDNRVEEMKVLKKMQDRIYKAMLDDGAISNIEGYGPEFDFILNK